MEIREYADPRGRSPFADWFNRPDATAAAKVAVANTRLEHGHRANVKAVGGGVLEYRIDSGPGYRVYFARDGDALIILLAGGTKRRQQNDIATAQKRWIEHEARRKG